MKFKKSKPFWQAVSLGVLAGMRTSSAPLIVNHILSRQPSDYLKKSPLNIMRSNKLGIVFKLFAGAELIADKLPSAPARTKPGNLAARCLSGTLSGAAIYEGSGNNALEGALLGLIAAAGSTFGSYLLRKNIVKKTQIFDPWIGAAEDMLVIGAAIALVKNEAKYNIS